MDVLAWELTGAVVGAGMASGREIASFFARYGKWGIIGIGISIAMMVYLADTGMPARWRGTWLERMWQLLQRLLLVFTGGAMLSGGGEIASLALHIHNAYWVGVIGTIVLSFLIARYTSTGLACVSKTLLAFLALMLMIGYFLPPMKTAYLETFTPLDALFRGATYGGFNAALQAPIMARALTMSSRERSRAARMSGIMVGVVLLLGYAVLRRHTAMISEALPFITLQTRIGKAGYSLASLCLYLAILSTLTACLRGLNATPVSVSAILLISTIGLSDVIDAAYPLLGGMCLLMLLAAKLVNCRITSFHSGGNMI